MTMPTALAGVDGLLLTGGDDVAPARYGETPHPTVVEVEPARDEFEIALVVDGARDAVCRSSRSAAACRC